jgi:hypothetical protein
MAANWIKLTHATPDKPEVARMAGLLGIDHDAVVGKLVRLWIWADQQTLNGNAPSVSKALLDRVTYATGFADALEKVGWLDEENGECSFPNFDRHNGQTSKARALTNNRVAAHMAAKTNAPSVSKALPEKRREESNHSMPPGGWSIEEVIAAGFRAGITPAICKLYHDSRMSVEWVDRNGNAIKSMPHDLAKYAVHYANNEARQSARPTQGQTRKPASVWELKQAIECADKEAERLAASPANRHAPDESAPWETTLKPAVAAKVKALKVKAGELRQQMAAAGEGEK